MSRSSQKNDIVLAINANLNPFIKEVNAAFAKIETASVGMGQNIAKSFTKAMGGLNAQSADLKATLDAVTIQLEAVAKAMDRSAKASKTIPESSKSANNQALKAVENVQTASIKRGVTGAQIDQGMLGFIKMNTMLENFGALGTVLATKISGAGILKDKGLQAAAMRTMTKLDKYMVEEIGGLGSAKALDKIARKTQKESTTALVKKIQDNIGQGTAEANKVFNQAVAGVVEGNTKAFKNNLKNIGKEAFALSGNAPLDVKAFKRQQLENLNQFIAHNQLPNQDFTVKNMFGKDVRKRGKLSRLESAGITATEQDGQIVVDIKAWNKRLNELVRNRTDQIYRNAGEAIVSGSLTETSILKSHASVEELAPGNATMNKLRTFFGLPEKMAKYTERAIPKSVQEQLSSGIDGFGYRLITISYMFSKVNMILSQAIAETKNAAMTRLEGLGKVQPIIQRAPGSGDGSTRLGSIDVMKYYKVELEKMAKDTGISFDNLARALYDSASAFPNITDQMMVMKTTTAMAAVGFGNAEKSMEALIAVSKTYYRDLEKNPIKFEAMIERMGDLAITAANVGVLEIDELANAMQNMAPTASALGITIEELFASISATAGVIGNTGEASTRVAQLFTALNSPGNKTLEGIYNKAKVVDGNDFIAQQGGLLEALTYLKNETGDDSFRKIFGRTQAAQAAMGLVGNKGDVADGAREEFVAFLDTAATGFYALENAQDKARNGIAQMERTMAGLDQELITIKANIGEKMLPMQIAYQEAVNKVIGLLNNSMIAGFAFLVAKFAIAAAGLMAFAGAIALASRAINQLTLESGKAALIKKVENYGGKLDPNDIESVKNGGSFLRNIFSVKRGVTTGAEAKLAIAGTSATTAVASAGTIAAIAGVGILIVAAIAGVVALLVKQHQDKVKKNNEEFEVIRTLAMQSEFNQYADRAAGLRKAYTNARTDQEVAAAGIGISGFKAEQAGVINQATAAIAILNNPVEKIAKAFFDNINMGSMGFNYPKSNVEYDAYVSDQMKNGNRYDRSQVVLSRKEYTDLRLRQFTDAQRNLGTTFSDPAVQAILAKYAANPSKDSAAAAIAQIQKVAEQIASIKFEDLTPQQTRAARFKEKQDEEQRSLRDSIDTLMARFVEGEKGTGPNVQVESEMAALRQNYVDRARETASGIGDKTWDELEAITNAARVYFDTVVKTRKEKFNDPVSAKFVATIRASSTTITAFDEKIKYAEEQLEKAGKASAALTAGFVQTNYAAGLLASLMEQPMTKALEGLKGEIEYTAEELAAWLLKLDAARKNSWKEKYDNSKKSGMEYALSIPTDPTLPQDMRNEGLVAALGGSGSATDIGVFLKHLETISTLTAGGAVTTSSFLDDNRVAKWIAANKDNTEAIEMLSKLVKSPSTARKFAQAMGGSVTVNGQSFSTEALALQNTKNVFSTKQGDGSTALLGLEAATARFDELVKTLDMSKAGDRSVYLMLNASLQAVTEGLDNLKDSLKSFKDQFRNPNAVSAEGIRKDMQTLTDTYKTDTAYTSLGETGEMKYEENMRAMEKRAKYFEGRAATGQDFNPILSWLESGGLFKNDKDKKPRIDFANLFTRVQPVQHERQLRPGEVVPGGGINSSGMLQLPDTFEKKFDFLKGLEALFPRTSAGLKGSGSTSTGNVGGGLFNLAKDVGADAAPILGDALGPMMEALGPMVGMFLGMAASLKPVLMLMNPLETILGAAMEVLSPVIDQLLGPLVGGLKILGQLLGSILVPILLALMPVVDAVVSLFVTFYNLLLPVFEFLMDCLVMIAVMIGNFGEVIRFFIDYLTAYFGKGKVDEVKAAVIKDPFAQFGTKQLTAITAGQVVAAGSSALSDDTSNSAGSSEATRLPDQYFYFYIGVDAITDTAGMAGKVVSVDYLFDTFVQRLGQAQSFQAS